MTGDVLCADCGSRVASDAAFCPQCGASRLGEATALATATNVWAPPTPGTAVDAASPTLATSAGGASPATDLVAEPHRGLLRPWMGVLLAVLLIGGGVTAWRLFGDADGESLEPPVSVTDSSLAATVTTEPVAPETTVATTVPETTALQTTVPETTALQTTVPATMVPETTVPATTVLPDDPAATPPVPDPEAYTGPGSPQVMNAPMPSGPTYDDVRSSLVVAQRLADAFAAEDWVNARSLLARPPDDDGGFGLAYGLTDRYSLLLLDARVDGPGYRLLLGTVRNEVNQTQTSVGCVEWYVEANRPIVDILGERSIVTYSGSSFSPEGLRNSLELDALLRSSCGWLSS